MNKKLKLINDLENKLAFPAVKKTIIRYQVRFLLWVYMCSCSETDMVYANTNGKNLDLKV